MLKGLCACCFFEIDSILTVVELAVCSTSFSLLCCFVSHEFLWTSLSLGSFVVLSTWKRLIGLNCLVEPFVYNVTVDCILAAEMFECDYGGKVNVF